MITYLYSSSQITTALSWIFALTLLLYQWLRDDGWRKSECWHTDNPGPSTENEVKSGLLKSDSVQLVASYDPPARIRRCRSGLRRDALKNLKPVIGWLGIWESGWSHGNDILIIFSLTLSMVSDDSTSRVMVLLVRVKDLSSALATTTVTQMVTGRIVTVFH